MVEFTPKSQKLRNATKTRLSRKSGKTLKLTKT